MSLANALGRAGGGPTGPTGTAVNLSELTGYRPAKFLIYGEFKSGKSTFILSIAEFLESLGKKPEECLVVLIDNDDGIIPLVKKGAVKPEWIPVFQYAPCTGMDDILNNTNHWLPKLQEHAKKHGPQTAWLVVDNMKAAWQWTRDKYAQDVYGMHEFELAKQKRLEARSQGKKMLPTFDQRSDYAVINPIHNEWAERIKLSGVNFIWATPSSSWSETKEDGTKETVVKASGQGDNPGRVDHLLYLYAEGDNHYADLTGTRTAPKLFKRMPDPTVKKVYDVFTKMEQAAKK